MGTFLTIVFLITVCALLYIFLKSPVEIIQNFFKAILNIFINVIPLSFLVKNAIAEERDMKEEKKALESLATEEGSDSILRVDMNSFDCFIFLNSNIHEAEVSNDVTSSIRNLENCDQIKITLSKVGLVHIVNIINLKNLSDIMRLVRFLSNEYGIDNTHGFLKSSEYQFFFQKNPENHNQIIGMTNGERTFIYSIVNFRSQNNFLAFSSGVFLPPKLNTDFFHHLLKSSK